MSFSQDISDAVGNFEALMTGDYYNSPAAQSPYVQSKLNEAFGSESSASALLALEGLYQLNYERALEAAQRQMDFQTSANKLAMDFSAEQAAIQRNWLAQMSNSSYQRAVKDLQAAGLNPILAYSQGGASVPSVTAASGVTSAGAQATMADTGYTSYLIQKDLDVAKINAAAKIASQAIETGGDIASSVIGS